MFVTPTGVFALDLSAAGLAVVAATTLHQDRRTETVVRELRPFLGKRHLRLIQVGEEVPDVTSRVSEEVAAVAHSR